MNYGKLIHSIGIQKKVVTRNDDGSEAVTWEEFTRAWASIDPVGGREYFLASQMQAPTDHRITIRYQPNIESEMRVAWNGRNFNIRSILNREERNIELVLMCQEF